MKLVSTTLLCLSLSLLSKFSLAESYSHSYNLKVTSVYAGYIKKNAFFEVDSELSNNAGCTAKAIAVDPERSDVEQVLSVLLYAHATGKLVDLQIYNESCFDSHRILRRVKVKNQNS
ncbi:hypothetical protein [Agaribacterium haliotis]|uniref:hypothetical protein n=1 Tax=Agaribacterium haliotis TaxID=2013869 RepID=UPI001177EC6B|nr:hypothetical protein [Agaribacterium haliotis]